MGFGGYIIGVGVGGGGDTVNDDGDLADHEEGVGDHEHNSEGKELH